MFIQPVPCDSDAFSHGKGGYNGTNSKSFDMPETESGEGSSDNQADYIEADLDFWICHRSDLGQFPWEKVSRDNRHFAAVGNSDSNTDQKECPIDQGCDFFVMLHIPVLSSFPSGVMPEFP